MLPVTADPGRLRQVFLNLLKNAMEATPPGGRIRVDVRPSSVGGVEDGWLVMMQDNGTGMPPDKLSKIFELFYTDKRGGSGLGLPICKKIIEDHGGHIEVESHPSKGSTFKIWIPKRSSGAGS